MSDVEVRVTNTLVEARSQGERRIGGYAAKFGVISRNLGGFVEVVERSFFNKSRGDGWPGVVARYNHDSNMLLGSTRGGTLRLEVDSVGLNYDIDVPASRQDVYELVQRGDIAESSFAWIQSTVEDEWRASDQGYPLRVLHSARLVDVSPLGETAAYPDTSAGLRSLAKAFDADFDEIRSMAAKDELRRLFRRTADGKPAPEKRTLPGTAALMRVLGTDPDPWAGQD